MTDDDTFTIDVNLPEAHSKKQALIANAFDMGVREVWLACGTKWGKTAACSIAISKMLLGSQGKLLRWIAPIASQSLIGMDYCRRMLPGEPYINLNKSNRYIEVPSLDSKIEFWHGQDPVNLEGAAVNHIVIDEAAKCKEQVYVSCRTTTTQTMGTYIFPSTPYGKNWFYNGCCEAELHQEWALKNNKPLEKLFLTARTIDNPFIDPKAVSDARKELPARLFAQYYLAEFISDGSLFVGFRECVFGPELHFDEQIHRWIDKDAKHKRVVIGCDWAKSIDFCLFLALDIETGKCVGFERFHKLAYTEAVKRLVRFSNVFKELIIIYHDQTGVGEGIDDIMSLTELVFQGVTFTNKSKSEMVTHLMTSFEHQAIGIPNYDVLLSELSEFAVKVSDSGVHSYNAPPGHHDDTVCGLMLANEAFIDNADRPYEIISLDDLLEKTKPSPHEKLYLFEDEDDDEF